MSRVDAATHSAPRSNDATSDDILAAAKRGRMRLLLVAAGLILAGCVVPAAQEAPVEPARTSPTPEAPAPTSEPPSTPAPANTSAPPETPAPRIVVVQGEARVTAAVGAPCVMNVRPCSRGPISPGALDVAEAGAGAATLEVTWTATTPAGAKARVEVRPAEGAALAQAEGASPILLSIPVEDLRPGTLSVFFEPVAGAVGVQEKAALVLTLAYV
jgi:hypothetical protein